MLALLYEIMDKHLPAWLDDPSKWESLIVNKRKPHTYRVFTQYGKFRVCLHKFNACDKHEAFFHPHPWPAAFTILSGSYQMYTGHSKDRESDPFPVADFILTPGSSYTIMLPRTWHMIVPVDTTYTVMVNGEPWSNDIAHASVRTTKGKDLEKMPEAELVEHLATFKKLLGEWRAMTGTLNTYKRLAAFNDRPKEKKKSAAADLLGRAADFFDNSEAEKREPDALQDGGQQSAGANGPEGVALPSE